MVGLVSWVGLARAQAPLPEIVYRAPAGCPDAEAFTDRVRARRRPAQDSRTPTARRLEVRIEQRGGRAIGHLRVVGADDALAQRSIEAATCGEAADALALIAALTLDPDAAEQPVRPAPEPPASRGDTERKPSTSDRDRGSPSGTPAPAEDARDTAEEPAPAAEPELREAPQPDEDEPREDATAARADDSDAPESSAASSGPGMRFARAGLFVSGFAASGLAPDIVPGLQLSLAIVAQLGSAELALRLGARFTPERTIADPEGTAELAYVSGLAGLCAGSRLAGDSAALWGCFSFEPGRSVARGLQPAIRSPRPLLGRARPGPSPYNGMRSVRSASWPGPSWSSPWSATATSCRTPWSTRCRASLFERNSGSVCRSGDRKRLPEHYPAWRSTLPGQPSGRRVGGGSSGAARTHDPERLPPDLAPAAPPGRAAARGRRRGPAGVPDRRRAARRHPREQRARVCVRHRAARGADVPPAQRARTDGRRGRPQRFAAARAGRARRPAARARSCSGACSRACRSSCARCSCCSSWRG